MGTVKYSKQPLPGAVLRANIWHRDNEPTKYARPRRRQGRERQKRLSSERDDDEEDRECKRSSAGNLERRRFDYVGGPAGGKCYWWEYGETINM